jgi:hypothetical protein
LASLSVWRVAQTRGKTYLAASRERQCLYVRLFAGLATGNGAKNIALMTTGRFQNVGGFINVRLEHLMSSDYVISPLIINVCREHLNYNIATYLPQGKKTILLYAAFCL